MAIPILSRRKERRQAELSAAIESGVEKAMSPAIAMAAAQSQASSGATYALNSSSPFNQLGPGGGFVPLPRPDGMFDSGFGPGFPLVPDALDPLTPSGRTMTRRAAYLVSANLQLIDRRVPWSVLKGLAEDVDVVARCIQIVQDALIGLDWSWGFSETTINTIMTDQDLTNSSKASAIAQAKFGDELDRVRTFFDYPDRRMDQTFSEWLTSIIFSHLVYDGICVAPLYNLGGELQSLSVIDTPTIKILLDNQGFLPQPPAPAYQQILYGFPRGEYQAEGVDRDGNVPNGFTDDQLFYKIRRPRADSVYGYSQVEECINIATIYMERQAWLHSEYSHGVTPRGVVTMDGTESWSPEAQGYYQQIVNDQWTGQTERRQQIMLMRPGMKFEQLKGIDEVYKSEYDQWLIMQLGAKFGIPQSQLGIQMHSSIGGGAAGKQQGDQSEQFATDAMKNFLIDCINDMARRFMGVGPEITITCTGGGNDDDDLTRAQADEIDVNSGIRSRNEIRSERGIPLDPSPEADQLGVTSPTGVTFLTGLLDQQKAAAELAAQPPAPPQTHTVTTAPDGTVTETHGAAPAAGSTSASVGSHTSASVGSTSASVAPKPSTKDDTPNVDAKDDPRQPDTDATKELAVFSKWARTHVGRSTRDFQFQYVNADLAKQLNDAARVGDLTVVKSLISDAKNTPTVRVIDPYAHIPADVRRLQGADAYPDIVVERVTLGYDGQPRSVETISSVHGEAPSVAQDAAKQSVADIVAERLSGDLERLLDARSELEKARSGV